MLSVCQTALVRVRRRVTRRLIRIQAVCDYGRNRQEKGQLRLAVMEIIIFTYLIQNSVDSNTHIRQSNIRFSFLFSEHYRQPPTETAEIADSPRRRLPTMIDGGVTGGKIRLINTARVERCYPLH